MKTLAGVQLLKTLAGVQLVKTLAGVQLVKTLAGVQLVKTLAGVQLLKTLAGVQLVKTLAGAQYQPHRMTVVGRCAWRCLPARRSSVLNEDLVWRAVVVAGAANRLPLLLFTVSSCGQLLTQ